MSPRRSSRARMTQPPTNGVQHSSTSSSTSSGRGDRNTRSNIRADGQPTSATPRSPSTEDVDGPVNLEHEARRTRQSKRDGDDEELLLANDNGEDDEIEDEGVTRCICGRQEYPGLPVPEGGSNAFMNNENLADDAGGLFIQCELCQVWQHGGCVGIMDEAMSPENYYCDECRKDLHRTYIGARGQKYSRYLPVTDGETIAVRNTPNRKSSEVRSSRETESKGSSSRPTTQSAKRRSTMNSRAAWDEEEVMRRVIEESKGDTATGSISNGARKGKRGRDESEDTKQTVKRRRTGSESESPPPLHTVAPATYSDVDAQDASRTSSNGQKKVRSAATQGLRERELRDRDLEKDRERAEAANKRKGRLERRRADESEPPEDDARTNGSGKNANTVSRPSRPASSRAEPISAIATTFHKKNGRPAARRGRLGRNQYTRDRDLAADSAMTSPHPSQPKDDDETGNGGSDEQPVHINGNGSKPSKPRVMNPNRTSMNDMKRRVAGILEYISRTQLDMAGEKSAVGNGGSRESEGRKGLENPGSKLSNEVNGNDQEGQGEGARAEVVVDPESGAVDVASFAKLSSLEMMDVLTRELVLWQVEHGKWGQK